MRRRLSAIAPVLLLLGLAAPAHAGQLVIRVPLPSVAIGASLGHTRVSEGIGSGGEGTARAVSVRLRFGRHLELAGEVAKTTVDAQTRTERSLGGGAYLHLFRAGAIGTYAGGAIGIGDLEQGSWYQADQRWAQLAAGMTVALSPSLAVIGEVDFGRRHLRMTGDTLLLRDTGNYADIYLPDQERYRQLRLGLVLSF